MSNANEKSKFMGVKVISAILGMTGINSLFSGIANLALLSSDFSNTVLYDMIFNSLVGIGFLVCAFLLWKRKKLDYRYI